MSGDTTIQSLKRLSWLPERDTNDNGNLIAGQERDNVYFSGGEISGVTLTGVVYSGFTASRGIVSSAAGALTAATTTAVEIGYVNGVTSAIQTQLNAKQATGNYITALTGDATAAGPGSAAMTLATVNANVGSFGSSTSIPTFAVNAKGLVTSASGNAVVAPAGTLTGATLAAGVTASSLTSVGTISSGTWNGTDVAFANIAQLSANTFAANPTASAGDISGVALAASNLAGRGSSGNIAAITLGASLTMTGAVLSVTTSAPSAASQSEQEAASSSTVYVSPLRQQFHPSACKAWCSFTWTAGVPTIATSYNISSLTDNAVGDVTFNFTTAFSSANYATTYGSTDTAAVTWGNSNTANAAGSKRAVWVNSTFNGRDCNSDCSFMAFGDQ